MNKPAILGRLSHWFLLMQKFDITIVEKPGKANLVADLLSQLHVLDYPIAIDNSFLNEHFLKCC